MNLFTTRLLVLNIKKCYITGNLVGLRGMLLLDGQTLPVDNLVLKLHQYGYRGSIAMKRVHVWDQMKVHRGSSLAWHDLKSNHLKYYNEHVRPWVRQFGHLAMVVTWRSTSWGVEYFKVWLYDYDTNVAILTCGCFSVFPKI